jgi:hypothetical protein
VVTYVVLTKCATMRSGRPLYSQLGLKAGRTLALSGRCRVSADQRLNLEVKRKSLNETPNSAVDPNRNWWWPLVISHQLHWREQA